MAELVGLYMRLMDEGVEVWRPIQAKAMGDDRFMVLGPVPEGEVWEFEPGSVVSGKLQSFSGGEKGVVAVQA